MVGDMSIGATLAPRRAAALEIPAAVIPERSPAELTSRPTTVTTRDALGRKITGTLDGGQLTSLTLPDGTTEEWIYDDVFGKVTQHVDPLGRVTLYELDGETGDLLQEIQVVGERDSEANEETDDVITSYTYTCQRSRRIDPLAIIRN